MRKEVLMVSFFAGVWISSTISLLKENREFLRKVKKKSKSVYFLLKTFMCSPLSFFIMAIQTIVEFFFLLGEGAYHLSKK